MSQNYGPIGQNCAVGFVIQQVEEKVEQKDFDTCLKQAREDAVYNSRTSYM